MCDDDFSDVMFSDDAEDDEDGEDEEDDEQTDGILSLRRKLAVFVVASWTLGNPVAPNYHYDDN